MVTPQRRHARKAIPVDFRGTDGDGVGTLVFEGADLSPGGTFLKSEVLLEEGERLWLEFHVPGVPKALKAQARVAWVRRFPTEPQPAGMGVEFLSMPDEDRALLQRYLGE